MTCPVCEGAGTVRYFGHDPCPYCQPERHPTGEEVQRTEHAFRRLLRTARKVAAYNVEPIHLGDCPGSVWPDHATTCRCGLTDLRLALTEDHASFPC